jgi:hypothetical protein
LLCEEEKRGVRLAILQFSRISENSPSWPPQRPPRHSDLGSVCSRCDMWRSRVLRMGVPPNVKSVQDMPPSGGYPSVSVSRSSPTTIDVGAPSSPSTVFLMRLSVSSLFPRCAARSNSSVAARRVVRRGGPFGVGSQRLLFMGSSRLATRTRSGDTATRRSGTPAWPSCLF